MSRFIFDPTSFTPQILAVCTGNICRSPAIERLLAHHLGGRAVVRSAGTHAVVGAPIQAPMAALLDQAGVSSTGFAACQATAGLVDSADLVLTATTDHRARVVELQPGAMRRTFTLLEFALAATSLPAPVLNDAPIGERVLILADHALLSRPRRRISAADLSIPDPFRQSDEVYQAVFTQLAQAVGTIADALDGPG
jgi:protein-tyrosine phosphatase